MLVPDLRQIYHRLVSIFRLRVRKVVGSAVPVAWLLLRVSTVFAEPVENFEIKLRWEKVPGAVRYKVKIGRQKNFKKIFVQTEISDPKWTWNYKIGTLGDKKRVYYRVASINRYGEIGKFSMARLILLPIPPPSVPIQRKKTPPMVASPLNSRRTLAMMDPFSVKESILRSGTHLRVMANLGMGGLSQSSETENLKNVFIQPGFIQQKFAVQMDFLKAADGEVFRRGWTIQSQFQYSTFKGVQDPRPFQQSDVSAYRFQFLGLRWNQISHSQFSVGYGLVLERSYRWVKNGTESVDAEGGISGGPQFSLVYVRPSSHFWRPTEFGVAVSAPFLGAWAGSYWAVEGSVWSEWGLLRIQGDFGSSGWSIPASTRLNWWSTWVGFVLHLGSSEGK